MNGFETGAEYQLPGLANLTPNLPVNLRIEKWNSLWPAFGLWCPVMGVLWFYSAVQYVYICPIFLRDASLPCPSHPGPQVEGEEVEITGEFFPRNVRFWSVDSDMRQVGPVDMEKSLFPYNLPNTCSGFCIFRVRCWGPSQPPKLTFGVWKSRDSSNYSQWRFIGFPPCLPEGDLACSDSVFHSDMMCCVWNIWKVHLMCVESSLHMQFVRSWSAYKRD